MPAHWLQQNQDGNWFFLQLSFLETKPEEIKNCFKFIILAGYYETVKLVPSTYNYRLCNMRTGHPNKALWYDQGHSSPQDYFVSLHALTTWTSEEPLAILLVVCTKVVLGQRGEFSPLAQLSKWEGVGSKRALERQGLLLPPLPSTAILHCRGSSLLLFKVCHSVLNIILYCFIYKANRVNACTHKCSKELSQGTWDCFLSLFATLFWAMFCAKWLFLKCYLAI